MNRNVVLITYDSLRADHCTPWGYERDTSPNLAKIGNDGVVFENAIAPASRTNPSMAGILTGEPFLIRDRVAKPQYARHHLRRHGTIAESLSEEDFATGAFCPNAYASRYYGFDRGFDQFEDFLFDNDLYQGLFDKHLDDSRLFTTFRNLRNVIRRQEAFKTWDTYVEDIESWANKQQEPFFLWVFSLDTHFPYLTPRKHRQWSGLLDQLIYNWKCNKLIDETDIELSEATRRKIMDIYDDSIHFGDILIKELQERLSEFDPIFIIHGDHGEAFGEHGVYGHFYPSLYESNIHVPLVIGNCDESGSINSPTSLIEIPKIIKRTAGISSGSVLDINHDWVVATDYDGRYNRNLAAIRTKNMKFISEQTTSGDGKEMYDLENDPNEQDDLSGKGYPIEEPLEKLANKWMSHEQEILAISRSARALNE